MKTKPILFPLRTKNDDRLALELYDSNNQLMGAIFSVFAPKIVLACNHHDEMRELLQQVKESTKEVGMYRDVEALLAKLEVPDAE